MKQMIFAAAFLALILGVAPAAHADEAACTDGAWGIVVDTDAAYPGCPEPEEEDGIVGILAEELLND